MKPIVKLWIGLAVLAILCPLGLLIPAFFKAGGAWGEWGPEEIKKLAGYVPEKFARLADLWKPAMPDYSFKGWEDKGLFHQSIAYIASAVVGIALIAGIAFILGKMLAGKDDKNEKP